MKIAVVTSGILPIPAVQGGAVETLVDHYLEYNDRHKLHDITVFSVFHPSVESHGALQSDVNHYHYIDVSSITAKIRKRIHGLLHRNTYYHYSIDYFFRQVLRAIKKEADYDCIVLENRPGYALGLRGQTKARLVYHLHNDFLNATTANGRELYEAASKIVAVSDYIRSRVTTCDADDQKTVTVHNGIDLVRFSVPPIVTRQSLGYAEDDFVLVFSGRLIPEKGILELVEAMKLLCDEPKIRLLVMGSSFYDKTANNDDPFIVELRSKAQGLGDRIKFTDYVKHGQIPDYLQLADVAVIPSVWQEPFGLTVAEAMAAGLPIIATNRGGILEMVTNQNAIVIPYPCDLTGNLAQAIRYLYHHEEKRRQMGAMSKMLSMNYSKEVYAKHFFEVIGTV